MDIDIIVIYSILTIFIFVGGFYFWFVLDSLIRGHDLPTNKKARQAICRLISEKIPKAKNFYDLGSGRGTVILSVKKHLPHLQVVGVDLSWFRCFIAKMKAMLLQRNVLIKKQDLFETNLNDADVVYTYIWYDLMPILEKKLQNDLKKGALVITNTSHFSTWPLAERFIFDEKLPGDFGTLFVYLKE